MTLVYSGGDFIPNIDDFSQSNLVEGIQNVLIYDEENNHKPVRVKGYQLPGYNSFEIRRHRNIWVLSIGGRLMTYGSYDHVVDVIMLIVTSFKCWHSKASMVYFLQLPEYSEVIDRIVKLRSIDKTNTIQS